MVRADHPFSLTRGGPFYRLLSRCHLIDRAGSIRWIWLAAIVWLPLIAATIAQLAFGRGVDFILLDPAMHARILIGLPLLVLADRLLEARCQAAARHVREEGIAERASLDSILDRAVRVRDSRLVEGVLAVLVLALGQATLWGISGWSGFAHRLEHPVRISFAGIWCFVIAVPVFQFIMLRWLWRWLLWAYVLARLSRLSLSLNAIHPDQAAGLGILSSPIDAFGVYVAAIASSASATWTTQILRHRATVAAFSPTFFTFVVLALVVACGPLLLFSGKLDQARHRDATAYHVLAREYVDAFRCKWLAEHPDRPPALGTGDIQTLNDLGGSYKTAEGTRLYPFGTRAILAIWAGALVPMLPVMLATTPISDIATRLGKMLLVP